MFKSLFVAVTETVDLIPDGSEITVDNKNLPEYLDAQLKYRTMYRIANQLSEFLRGFYEVLKELYYFCGFYSL